MFANLSNCVLKFACFLVEKEQKKRDEIYGCIQYTAVFVRFTFLEFAKKANPYVVVLESTLLFPAVTVQMRSIQIRCAS